MMCCGQLIPHRSVFIHNVVSSAAKSRGNVKEFHSTSRVVAVMCLWS